MSVEDPGPIKVHKLLSQKSPPEHPMWWEDEKGTWVSCWFGHTMDISHCIVLNDGTLDPPIVKCNWKGCTFRGRMRLQGWRTV